MFLHTSNISANIIMIDKVFHYRYSISSVYAVNHLVQVIADPKCIAMETKMMFPLMQVRVYRDDSLFAMHVLWPS